MTFMKVGHPNDLLGSITIFKKQGPDLRDLRRPLEGVIFWDDIWLNWTHFGSLTEDNPDFLKQIFRGCFGLHLASEAEI